MREPTWPEIQEWAEKRLQRAIVDMEDAVGEQGCGRAQGRVKAYREVLNLPSILQTREAIRQQIAAHNLK